MNCACRVETITYIYPDGRYVRQPYYHLCPRSNGTSPCREARYYDLGERILVPSDNAGSMEASSRPKPIRRGSTTSRHEVRGLRRVPGQQSISTNQQEIVTGNQPAPRQPPLSPGMHTQRAPIYLEQPNPPQPHPSGNNERPRRASVTIQRKTSIRKPARPDEAPNRQASTARQHGQYTPKGSVDLKSPLFPSTSWPSSQTPPHSPGGKKVSPTSMAVEADDDPEVGRPDYRAQRREQKAAESRKADRTSATEAELRHQLAEVIAERDELARERQASAERKKRESLESLRVRDLERRLEQLELERRGGTLQNARHYIAETREPSNRNNTRQERHHRLDNSGITTKESSRRRNDGPSSRPSTRRGDDRATNSSGRTLYSNERAASRVVSFSDDSEIEDETQDEEVKDEGKKKRRKGKKPEKKRR